MNQFNAAFEYSALWIKSVHKSDSAPSGATQIAAPNATATYRKRSLKRSNGDSARSTRRSKYAAQEYAPTTTRLIIQKTAVYGDWW